MKTGRRSDGLLLAAFVLLVVALLGVIYVGVISLYLLVLMFCMRHPTIVLGALGALGVIGALLIIRWWRRQPIRVTADNAAIGQEAPAGEGRHSSFESYGEAHSVYDDQVYDDQNVGFDQGNVSDGPKSSDSWWHVLGIARNADEVELREAYLRSIKEYHPDRVIRLDAAAQKVAIEQAKRVNVAYEEGLSAIRGRSSREG